MLEYDKVKDSLLKNIGEKRFLHSMRVMKVAEKLAEIYNCDIKNASIAGLLHDCGRLKDKSLFTKLCIEYKISSDVTECENNLSLLHGYLGAKIANEFFKIEDENILNSIKYHTTGRPEMDLFEKIIYLADYIEPGRNFEGIEHIRSLALTDIDDALLCAMDNTIKYVIDSGWLIHCDTIQARNYLISKKQYGVNNFEKIF